MNLVNQPCQSIHLQTIINENRALFYKRTFDHAKFINAHYLKVTMYMFYLRSKTIYLYELKIERGGLH